MVEKTIISVLKIFKDCISFFLVRKARAEQNDKFKSVILNNSSILKNHIGKQLK